MLPEMINPSLSISTKDKPSQADLRARYFDGYPARGLVFPSADATWWHRDADGCRVIGLDITALGNDLTKQLTWLSSTLNTSRKILSVELISTVRSSPALCWLHCAATLL